MPYTNIIGHIMLVEPFRFTILLIYNVHSRVVVHTMK